MKILIFISVAAIILVKSSCSDVISGKDPCTRGPSFWCANITNAEQCKSVNYCIDKVWKTVNIRSEFGCESCITLFKMARDDIRKVAEKVIRGRIIKYCMKNYYILKEMCEYIAYEFYPVIEKVIKSEVDPQVICHITTFCIDEYINKQITVLKPTSKTVKKIIHVNKNNKKLERCEGCLSVVGKVNNNFKSLDRNQILKRMIQVCAQLSILSDVCQYNVYSYFDTMYSHLHKFLGTNELCLLAGECSGRFHQHSSHSSHNKEMEIMSEAGGDLHLKTKSNDNKYDEVSCNLCAQMAYNLRDFVTIDTSVDEFGKILLAVCSQTYSFVEECKSVVEVYYPKIYEFLTKNLNGTMLCGMVGICPGLSYDHVILPPMEPPENDAPKKSSSDNSLPDRRYSTIISCEMCLLEITYFEKELKIYKSEKQVKEMLKIFVSQFFLNQKKDVANVYVNLILDALLFKKQATEICLFLKLCPVPHIKPSVKKIGDGAVLQNTSSAPTSTKDTKSFSECPICESTIKEFTKAAQNNKTDVEILNAVKSSLSSVPKTLHEKYDDFIKKYNEAVFGLFHRKVDPSSMCSLLNLCTTKKKTPSEEDDDTCAICRQLLRFMSHIYKYSKTPHDEENVLKKTCNVIPPKYFQKCKQILTGHGHDMFVKIPTYDPKKGDICSEVKVCHERHERGVEHDDDKCSWGAGYWCESTINAMVCDEGALEFCQENVWHALTKP